MRSTEKNKAFIYTKATLENVIEGTVRYITLTAKRFEFMVLK